MMQTNSNKYENILRSIYYDPKHPASFSSDVKLYRDAKKIDNTVTLKNVKDWLSGEFVYTLHKPVRKRFIRNPIVVENIDKQWEADLVDMQEFSRQNSRNRYILTVIDVFSKYAWAKYLKNKKGNSIVDAFKEIINEGTKPQYIRTDQGTEFKNQNFKSFVQNNGIKHFTSNNKDIKCAIVERFNRTLKSRMFKYFTAKGNRKYIDVLDDFVSAYNGSYHRSIKMRPIDVTYGNTSQVFENLYGVSTMGELKNIRSTAKLNPKDFVRKQYNFTPFDKGYYPNWSDQIYEVQSVNKGQKKTLYSISDETNQRFYPEQLQKVRENLYRIERVLRTRQVGNKKQYYVKWLGHSNDFNSWIDEGEIVRL